MHLLEMPIDYSRKEDFDAEVNKLTLDDAKKLVKKLYEDNRNFKKVAARAAITIEQYKNLLTVFDGYSEDKENISELGANINKMLVGTFEASKNLSAWVGALCHAARDIVFEDPVTSKLFHIVGNVCREIYTCSSEYKLCKILLPEESKGIRVRNLERSEEENRGNATRGFYSHQSALINGDEENAILILQGGKNISHKERKSSVGDEISSHEHDTGGVESDSSLKEAASASENEDSEGMEEKSVSDGATPERRTGKTFGISYPKSQNLFECDGIQNKNISANISVKCSASDNNTAFDQLTRSESHSDDNESISENEMTEDVDSFSLVNTSKSPLKSKRKGSLNVEEDNVRRKGKRKRKSNTSQNSGTVTKRSRKSKKSHASNTLTNYDDVKDTEGSETIALQSSTSSKRHQRSKKHETANIPETQLSENDTRKKGKTLKHDSFVASETKHDIPSETEVEGKISSVKPKRNRRGRRKKQDVTQEHETNKTFKSSHTGESVSFKNVPYIPSSDITKRACVVLTDVLEDPEVQHYSDIIQYMDKKQKAGDVKWKEKLETEETASNKERNETDALQEWNVLDAVSDEEDKEFDDTEGDENEQNSEYDEQETVNDDVNDEDDDGEQVEVDSDKELEYCSDAELDKGHSDKESDNNSDNETVEHKKGPSTSDVSPHESDIEDNSDVHDDNDADSVRSNDDADISSRSPTPGSPKYGKKGPRTPPSPAPFEPLRRGPQTPPGYGSDSEVMDDEENDSEYSSSSESSVVRENFCSNISGRPLGSFPPE